MAPLRSDEWYAGDNRNAYIHRAWMRRGTPGTSFHGRPQIAIANTASDLTPCNSHLDQVADSVKQGVWAAGGVPLNLPVVSLGETQVRPTAMLWRNMAAMAIEEMLRANPIDGVVRRYSLAGELTGVLEVGVPRVSCAAFVGPGLDRLLVTTATKDLSDADLRRYPDSGRLFLADVGTTGLPATPWTGFEG